jgi:hypothetical protein
MIRFGGTEPLANKRQGPSLGSGKIDNHLKTKVVLSNKYSSREAEPAARFGSGQKRP